MSAKAKHRRRSSFVQGRRRSHIVKPFASLSPKSCHSTSNSLPACDRLLDLIHCCFEASVLRVNEELNSSADPLPKVSVQGIQTKLQRLECLNAEAQSTDVLRDSQIQEICQHITELQIESRQWEDVVQAAARLDSSVENQTDNTAKQATKHEHSEMYADVLKSVGAMWTTVEQEAAVVQNSVRMLTSSLHFAQAYVQRQVTEIADIYYPSVEHRERVMKTVVDGCHDRDHAESYAAQ